MVPVIWQTVINISHSANGESFGMITFRHLIWAMMAAAGLMLSVSQSFAQKPDVGDQPGLIADDSVELDPEYRKPAGLYRPSEARANITRKAGWPDRAPPPEMIARQPYLPRFMAGGPGNPLGARAMYLGTTVYRIHGTNRPDTIGTAVSSGCFRLVNADVADLYDRVPVGTKVIVRQKPEL